MMRRFQEHHLEDAAAHYDVGKEFLDMGKLEEALVELDQALERKPKLTRAWMLKAEAHRRLGRYDEAESDVKRARALGAPEPWKEAELGRIDLSRGHAADARDHFQLSLRLEPTNVETLRLLEESQRELGDSAGVADTRARLTTLSGTKP